MNKLQKLLGSLLVGSTFLNYGCADSYRYNLQSEEQTSCLNQKLPDCETLGVSHPKKAESMEEINHSDEKYSLEQVIAGGMVEDMKIGTFERKWFFGAKEFNQKYTFRENEDIIIYLKFPKRYGNIDARLNQYVLEKGEGEKFHSNPLIYILKSDKSEAMSILSARELKKEGKFWRLHWDIDGKTVASVMFEVK